MHICSTFRDFTSLIPPLQVITFAFTVNCCFFLMMRATPRSTRTDTPFPYTTLFRSLPAACRDHGARILPGTKADRIVWQTAIDGRREAEAVKLILPDGSQALVRARVGVIVAGGTIASSKLLSRSDIDGTGRHVSLNIASPVVALLPPGIGGDAWGSEERRVGDERVRTCRFRWSPPHYKPNSKHAKTHKLAHKTL